MTPEQYALILAHRAAFRLAWHDWLWYAVTHGAPDRLRLFKLFVGLTTTEFAPDGAYAGRITVAYGWWN